MAKGGSRRPRRRPRQERARHTRDSILTATEVVVAREGTRRATTNRIAERAGVSIGSLYQYFPNKGALIETLRGRERDGFESRLEERIDALGALPLRDTIAGLVALLIGYHRERLPLHNALAADETDFHRAVETRWLPLVVRHLDGRREELRPTDLPLAARIAFDVLESQTHGVALRRPELLDDPAYAGELTELVHRYLAK